MNTIGDAISYAVDGVYCLVDTIKYYVRGVPPAIPDDGNIVFVELVQANTDQHGVPPAIPDDGDIVFVVELVQANTDQRGVPPAIPDDGDSIVRMDELPVPSSAETEHESTPVIEHNAPPVQPSLVARVAYSFVLEEILNAYGQTAL